VILTNPWSIGHPPHTHLVIRTHNLWGPEGLPLLLPLALETLKSLNPNSVYRVGFWFAVVFSLFVVVSLARFWFGVIRCGCLVCVS